MKSVIRLSMFAAVGAGLVACGGGAKLAPGPENAAAALHQATGPTGNAQTAASTGGLTSGLFSTTFEQPADCDLSGKVVFKFDLLSFTSLNPTELTYGLTYQDCQQITYDDPKTDAVETDPVKMNGTVNVTMNYPFNFSDTTTTTTEGELSIKLKGKIDFSGAISDFIDADVTEYIAWAIASSDTGSTGSISVRLGGTIKTSSENLTYDSTQSISFEPGKISAAGDISAEETADAGG